MIQMLLQSIFVPSTIFYVWRNGKVILQSFFDAQYLPQICLDNLNTITTETIEMFSADRIRSSFILFETGKDENHFLYSNRCLQQGNAAKSLSILAPCIKTSSREWRTGGTPTSDCELCVVVHSTKYLQNISRSSVLKMIVSSDTKQLFV
jgi:hypothetical protein